MLEIFRGVRTLTLTNAECYGNSTNKQAKRRNAVVSGQQNVPQFFEYIEIKNHRDVDGQRATYHVLWGDGTLSWEPVDSFTRSVVASEGHEINVIATYEAKAAAAQRRAASGARPRSGSTYQYAAITNHKDLGKGGTRSHYEVRWDNGSSTWEPIAQILEDVERCEGKQNVITRYEDAVHEAKARRSSAAAVATVESTRESATWVESTPALTLSTADRARADERLAYLPRVPSLLPWSTRSPLTRAAGRMKMHDYIIYAKHWAAVHLRGFFTPEIYCILIAYFDYLSRLMARSICLSEVRALNELGGVVLSELELVLPATEFSILVHALVHVPDQLAWFGPSNTTWMFAFERFSCNYSKPLIIVVATLVFSPI